MRAPQLYRSLRLFCLGAFSVLARDVEDGADIPFAFEEHGSPGRPALYEFRPLLGAYIEARAERLTTLADARLALDELKRLPAAAIYARAHAGTARSEEQALTRTVLLPVLEATAERCGGFDWDDAAFDYAYGELERSLLGERRTYGAVAPLTGISVGRGIDLGSSVRIRPAASGELKAHWPEATRLLPADFGREADRACVLELEQELGPRAEAPPDAPAHVAAAVTALRLATAGPVAAGPVLFERLDWRPYGITPVPPIAASQPSGEPTRLDAFRGRLARDVLERLAGADGDAELADALDRWELALFQQEPFRGEQLRAALAALLGGGEGLFAAILRASMLLGETPRERAALLERLRGLARGEGELDASDDVRHAIVETVTQHDRAALLKALDEALLGLRPRPAGYFATAAAPGEVAARSAVA